MKNLMGEHTIESVLSSVVDESEPETSTLAAHQDNQGKGLADKFLPSAKSS